MCDTQSSRYIVTYTPPYRMGDGPGGYDFRTTNVVLPPLPQSNRDLIAFAANWAGGRTLWTGAYLTTWHNYNLSPGNNMPWTWLDGTDSSILRDRGRQVWSDRQPEYVTVPLVVLRRLRLLHTLIILYQLSRCFAQ